MIQSNILKFNNLLILFLLFTLLAGSHLVVCSIGGIEFSAYRFVLVLSVVYLLFTRQLTFYTNRFSTYVFFVFLVWFAYGAISLSWAPSLLFGIKELFYIGVGLTSYVVFLSLSRAVDGLKPALEKIWTVSFISVIGFLLFEMLTQRHFEGEYLRELAELGTFHKANFIPIFTFINQNILGIYFCISIVFAAYFLIQNRNILLNSVMILTGLDFLLLTESRLGILCLCLILAVTLFLLLFKNVRSKIAVTFTRKQGIVLVVFAGLNVFAISSEIQFLKSDSAYQFEDDQHAGEDDAIRRKIARRVKQDGKILLMSNTPEASDTTLQSDQVFAIENGALLKLLDGEPVTLQLSRVYPELHRKLFIGNNGKLLLTLSFVFLVLIGVYLSSVRFGVKEEMLTLLFCAGLFLLIILPRNSYRFPVKGYKEYVLTEPGFDTKKLTLGGLGIISSDFRTGELLMAGKGIATSLFSKNEAKGTGCVSGEHLGSNTVRKNLILNGLYYLRKSGYMGVGAGGFQASNMLKRNKYPDNGVGGAHNFVIEILSQYGIIIFALLLSIVGWILFVLVRTLGKGMWDEKHFLVLWLLITLVFMGNSNSTFLSLPINWLLVVFILVFANELMESRNPADENKL